MSNPIPSHRDDLLQSKIRRDRLALLAAEVRGAAGAIRRALDEMVGSEPQAQARGVPWGLPDPFAPSGEDAVLRACARLDELAGQVQTAADISALLGAPRLERVKAAVLIGRAADAMHARGVELVRDAPAGLECTCDPAQLALVLYNLAENACRAAAQAGTGRGPVRLRAEAAPGYVRFSVTDPGAGIPADALEGLFRAFAEGRSDGAGLAVAQAMVEKHGGKLWGESREGKGSTFVVLIPER